MQEEFNRQVNRCNGNRFSSRGPRKTTFQQSSGGQNLHLLSMYKFPKRYQKFSVQLEKKEIIKKIKMKSIRSKIKIKVKTKKDILLKGFQQQTK